MRTVFNIEIKCDLPTHDEQRRKTFIRLMMEATRKLYSQSTMLAAEMSPEIMVTIEDRNGSKEIHLFDENGNPVSE
jgi:hypothetical protein